MKTFISLIVILICTISCKTKNITDSETIKPIVSDTIRIVNEELEYQVIIIDGGFTNWLNSRSFPRGYHTLTFLENRNKQYVGEWNRRFLNSSYNRNLYDMQINYDESTRYGYEVNYLIYNYMVYFQNTNKQRLFGIVPPR